jgi:hypothetical protein
MDQDLPDPGSPGAGEVFQFQVQGAEPLQLVRVLVLKSV